MERAEALQKLRNELGRPEFERRYPHLWLIRELDEADPASGGFNTVNWDSKKTLHLGQRFDPAAPLMSTRLRQEPGRFALYPVVKSGANPWSDRVMLGRAANNDIVFRHESVSKVHAYFQRGSEGSWQIYDAKSVNGTRVNGQSLPPSEGLAVESGAVLVFGTAVCELISSGELFEAL
jgi:hypothetical protein